MSDTEESYAMPEQAEANPDLTAQLRQQLEEAAQGSIGQLNTEATRETYGEQLEQMIRENMRQATIRPFQQEYIQNLASEIPLDEGLHRVGILADGLTPGDIRAVGIGTEGYPGRTINVNAQRRTRNYYMLDWNAINSMEDVVAVMKLLLENDRRYDQREIEGREHLFTTHEEQYFHYETDWGSSRLDVGATPF